jgi:hypothetical protein
LILSIEFETSQRSRARGHETVNSGERRRGLLGGLESETRFGSAAIAQGIPLARAGKGIILARYASPQGGRHENAVPGIERVHVSPGKNAARA